MSETVGSFPRAPWLLLGLFALAACEGGGGGGGGGGTPDTIITGGPGPGDQFPSPGLSFSFVSTLPGSTFQCSMDFAPFVACTSPFTPAGPLELGALPLSVDNQHTFSVRAVNGGAVDPTPASVTWWVDDSLPETTIDSMPPANSPVDSASFTFSTDEGDATFECTLDGTPWAPCASPLPYAALSEEPHGFAVRARDPAGHLDPTPAAWNWTVDLTDPETTIGSAPPAFTNVAMPMLEFSANEPASFICTLDGGGPFACVSPFGPGPLADGAHSFTVFATDLAGNVDATPSAAAWTQDTVPPLAGTVLDGAGPDEDWQDDDTAYAGNWTGFSDPEGPLERYEWALGTAPGADDVLGWQPVGLATAAAAALPLARGVRHYATVKAVDPAGNETAASSDGTVVNAARFLGNWDEHPGELYADVFGDGPTAFVGHFSTSGGVDIVDFTDPTAPVLLTTWTGAGGNQIKDLKVHNGIGYFASDNGGGLRIVDVSAPAAPTLLSTVTSAEGGFDRIHNVSYHAGFLYEADSRTAEVRVFDVRNPAAPSYLRSIFTPSGGVVHDITVLGGRLYTSVITGGGSTDVFDVSDVVAATPLLGSFATGPSTHANWPSADRRVLSVARETGGGDVKLWDVTVPAAAFLLATIDPAAYGIDAFSAHNTVIEGDLLYLSWYQAGLLVFDIADPTAPLPIARYDTFPGGVAGFDGNWGVYPVPGTDLVLLSDIRTGLYVVEIDTG